MTWIYELVPTCPAFLLSALGSEQVAETGCAANKLTCGGKLEALSNGFFCLEKTKKSVAKRFKLSSTGKLIRRTPGFRHLLASKSTKQKRRASRDKLVDPGHAAPLKRCLPFGL